MSRNHVPGAGRVAASAAPRPAAPEEASAGVAFTLGRHVLAAPGAGPAAARPLEWLSVVGAALCEIASMREELAALQAPEAAPLASALAHLHGEALGLLNAIARDVRGH